MNRPIPMSQQDLVATLQDILDRIKVGDSLEGHIEWLTPDMHDPEDAYAMVRGAYRMGNRDHGQGFMQFVGELDGQPDPLHAELDHLRAQVASLNVELAEGPLPVLLGWETAPFNEVCGWCPNGIAEGARVAILSTAHRVCEPCASGQRRGAR